MQIKIRAFSLLFIIKIAIALNLHATEEYYKSYLNCSFDQEPFKNYIIEGECIDCMIEGNYALIKEEDSTYRATGQFRNGKPEGEFIFFSSSGDTIARINYTDGILNGKVILWYNPVVLKEYSTRYKRTKKLRNRMKLKAVYIKGKIDGITTYWYSNGQKRSEYLYDRGVLKEASIWDKDGTEIKNHPKTSKVATARRDKRRDHECIKNLMEWIYKYSPCKDAEYFQKNYTVIIDSSAAKPYAPFRVLRKDSSCAVKGKLDLDMFTLEGDITFFSRTGDSLAVIHYNQGVINGPVTLWHSTHSLNEQGIETADTAAGPPVRLETAFKSGVILGKYVHWHADGGKKVESYYEPDNSGYPQLTAAAAWDRNGVQYDSAQSRLQALRDKHDIKDYIKNLEFLLYHDTVNVTKHDDYFSMLMIGGDVGLTSAIHSRFIFVEMPFQVFKIPRLYFTVPLVTWAFTRVDTSRFPQDNNQQMSVNPFPFIVGGIPLVIGYFGGIENKVYNAISFSLLGICMAPHVLTNFGFKVVIVSYILELDISQRTDYFLFSKYPKIHTETRAGLNLIIKQVGIGVYGAKPYTEAYYRINEPYIGIRFGMHMK